MLHFFWLLGAKNPFLRRLVFSCFSFVFSSLVEVHAPEKIKNGSSHFNKSLYRTYEAILGLSVLFIFVKLKGWWVVGDHNEPLIFSILRYLNILESNMRWYQIWFPNLSTPIRLKLLILYSPKKEFYRGVPLIGVLSLPYLIGFKF